MKPEARGLASSSVAGDKNVMPSMVVRQQRFQQLGISANPAHKRDQSVASSSSAANPPDESISSLMNAANELSGSIQQQQQLFDQDGLVLPKRVPHHPISAAQPIIRDLNRELKFNQVRGKNVLDQKSELKRAMERLEESRRRKEAEQERLGRRTSLELRLEERAERIAKETSRQSSTSAPSVPEKGTSTTCNSIGGFSLRPSVAR